MSNPLDNNKVGYNRYTIVYSIEYYKEMRSCLDLSDKFI